MKDKILKIVIIFLLFGFVGCKNNIDNSNNNSKEDFIDSVVEIMNLIENIPNKDEYQNDYNIYHLKDDYLYGYNYNTKNLEYEYNLEWYYEYGLNSGIIIENKNKEIYLSIEDNNYCAIKDFSNGDISIYDISERNKCHIIHTADESLRLGIFSRYFDNNEIYIPGEVGNGFVSLSAFHNILDDTNCTYTWYRNNEIIVDSNVQTYVVTSNFEDANYYVEIITNNGEVYKSEPINVKIDRR